MSHEKNIYVGNRYVPELMGLWDKSKEYEGLSIVQWEGNSFTSKKRVPIGIELSNEVYWVSTGNYNAQIENYRREIVNLKKDTNDLFNQLTVNVKSNGVVGDGIKDDTVDIQKIFSSGNKKIYFPEGTYKVTQPIRVEKNTLIECHPKAIIKRMGGYSHRVLFINGEMGNFDYSSNYNGDGNIHFKGGTFDLNTKEFPLNTVNSNISCFSFLHAKDCSFAEITIQNGQNGHYFQIASCKNVTITNSIFKNQYHTHLTSYDFETIQVEEGTSISFPDFGSYDDTISKDVFVTNCVFENVIRGVGNHSFPRDIDGLSPIRRSKNLQVKDCTFTNLIGSALFLEAYDNVTVEDNTIEQVSKENGIYLYYTTNSKIKDNTLKSVGLHGIHLKYSMKNKVIDNFITDVSINESGSFSGIRIDFSNDNTLNGNVLTGTSIFNYAMYFTDSSNNKIKDFDYINGIGTKDLGGIAGEGNQLRYQHFGTIDKQLFSGELFTVGDTFTFEHDLRSFSQLIIVGNNNGSSVASTVTMNLPKSELRFGDEINQYRFMASPNLTTENFVQFYFNTDLENRHSITISEVSGGSSRIRRIVGLR